MAGELPPPSVRWIRAARRVLHRRWRALLAIAAALGLLSVAARSPYTVAADQTAALLTFGHLHTEPVQPGLHLRLPLFQEVLKVSTGEVARIEIYGESSSSLSFLSADTNLIDATAVVQYRVGSLGDYLFGTEDPETLLRLAVRAALVEQMARTPVDDILTSAKTAIQDRLRSSAQERLDHHHSGLTLLSISLQSVQPPGEASGAFREVSDSRAEAAQSIDQAEGERGRRIRLARGEAEQILAEARTAANARRQQARGAAERFEALLANYREAPDQTRDELYLTTLRDVLPRARLIVLPPGGKSRIDVQLIDDTESLPPLFSAGDP